MTKDEASRMYDDSSDDVKRLFGTLGILFFYDSLPNFMFYLRRLIREKNCNVP